MSDINKKAAAQKVFDTLCASLDARNWHYEKDVMNGNQLVHFGVKGEDIPMSFIIVVDEERQVIRLLSRLPFTVEQDKRIDLAIATTAVTNTLANGGFDYDITSGSITFRLTASFIESTIGDGMLRYLVNVSTITVDRYNDKFLALSKGLTDITDFLGGL